MRVQNMGCSLLPPISPAVQQVKSVILHLDYCAMAALWFPANHCTLHPVCENNKLGHHRNFVLRFLWSQICSAETTTIIKYNRPNCLYLIHGRIWSIIDYRASKNEKIWLFQRLHFSRMVTVMENVFRTLRQWIFFKTYKVANIGIEGLQRG